MVPGGRKKAGKILVFATAPANGGGGGGANTTIGVTISKASKMATAGAAPGMAITSPPTGAKTTSITVTPVTIAGRGATVMAVKGTMLKGTPPTVHTVALME